MCLLRYDILRWWSKSSRENSWWPQQVPNEQGYVHSIGFTLTADSLHIREPWRASQNCSGRSPWIGVGSLLRWQQARFKSLGRTYLQLKADYKYVMYEHHLTQETVPDTWSVRPMLRILQKGKTQLHLRMNHPPPFRGNGRTSLSAFLTNHLCCTSYSVITETLSPFYQVNPLNSNCIIHSIKYNSRTSIVSVNKWISQHLCLTCSMWKSGPV